MNHMLFGFLLVGQIALAAATEKETLAPPPERLDVNPSLQDMMVWNVNYDDTHTAASIAGLTAKFSPSIGFVVGVREAPYGAPASSAGTPQPTWNWNGGGLSWLRDMHTQPWMQGRWLMIEPLASMVYEGSPAYGAAWESNMRWRYYSIAKQFPTAAGIAGWIHTNEPDNIGGSAEGNDFVRDFTDKSSDAALTASLDRNVTYARVEYEQLRGINQPSNMILPPHPGFIIGPCGAFPSYTRRSVSNHLWGSAEFLARNSGEVLDYYDAIDYHYHNVGMSRLESFTDAAPPTNAYSPYNVWRALDEANAARVAASKSPRLLPMTTSETGWGELNWSSYGNPPVYYPDIEAYKSYKLGTQYCGAHWFGFSMWNWYALVNSHAATDYNSLKTDYSEKKHYATILDIHDWRKYDINNLATYPLNFTAKTWENFNRPYTWAVHYDASRYPTAADFPPAIPFPEWRVITFNNGSLKMDARTSRNLAYRPIYLRQLVLHRFEIDVAVTGGASAKLRARGYDKLNGRAQVADTTTTSRTLRVDFTPRQHNMGRGLPDPAYVLIALDHDGKGTATWSNPRIQVVNSSVQDWREYDINDFAK